jgi:hypothetical protein
MLSASEALLLVVGLLWSCVHLFAACSMLVFSCEMTVFKCLFSIAFLLFDLSSEACLLPSKFSPKLHKMRLTLALLAGLAVASAGPILDCRELFLSHL